VSETLVWIVGAGGLLGSRLAWAVSRHVPNARVWQCASHLSWTDFQRLPEELKSAVDAFAVAVRSQRCGWAVLWCAGKGSVNSPSTALEPEWRAWTQLLALLGHSLIQPYGETPGCVFLASSAGGVYGGSRARELTEESEALPASAYGVHKLRMEETLRNWASTSANVSVLIGRIATLYGPGQDLQKAQGIISHLSRCLIHRRPVGIYVPLDTRRDYLFADDCAEQIATSLARLLGQRTQTVLKLFASERLTSIGQILGIYFRIAKHRSLVMSRQAAVRQPMTLKFRSEIWRDLGGSHKTDLAAGIHLLHQHQLTLFQRGLLPPPG
jgi:UDP-glucose 4-epimerase